MEVQAGKMLSVEVGVDGPEAAKAVASALMNAPSPSPGVDLEVSAHAMLKYLRSSDMSESAAPSAWVNFAIRYDESAEVDPIVKWLLSGLQGAPEVMTFPLDRQDVPLEAEPMKQQLQDRMGRSW